MNNNNGTIENDMPHCYNCSRTFKHGVKVFVIVANETMCSDCVNAIAEVVILTHKTGLVFIPNSPLTVLMMALRRVMDMRDQKPDDKSK